MRVSAIFHPCFHIGWVLSFLFAACTVSPTSTEEPQLETLGAEPASVLSIYNWDTYIDPAILTGFEQEFGVTINYSIYASNEEMLETIQAGPVDYDIVVPGDYMVEIMRREGLLAPLNRDNVPNLANVDPSFLSPAYDPGNRYCVPYQWGTIGIGYDIETTGGEIRGWKDFFDPAYAGRISMLDDARESLGVALLYLGYSPNTTAAAEIAAARDFLIEHSEHIMAYAPDTGQDLLVAGEVDLVFEWSGDIFQVMEDEPDIRYVIPEEGSIVWTDNMCILASAAHQELAEMFINYVLEPEIGAALSNYTHYSSPNQAALFLVDAADLENPALYPSAEVRERLFFLVDVGPEAAQLYEQAWADVMAEYER